jgi:dihydrofolate synthase/folylpolyglutamate synthase
MSVLPALNIRGRSVGRIRPALGDLRRVLAELGDPQRRFHSVLVVGTNGKGSTAALLAAVLRAHSVRTGLFTSPHLVRVEERVRVDGAPVDEATLARQIESLDPYPELTFFEVLTAAAFSVFSDAGIEIAVLEAGMGGSWDATRLAGSAIAGLTNVGSDHAGWLGSTPADIARDKGQALAAAGRAVMGRGVAAALVPELGAPAARRADSLVRCEDAGGGRVRIAWEGRETLVKLPLAGAHQVDNLELALALAVEAVAAGWFQGLDPLRVRAAVEGVSWPGRLSVHRLAGREVLVDCAHNLEAVVTLAQHLDAVDRRYNLLFSCLDDKPVEAMAQFLCPRVGEIVVCPLDDERAMPLERLAAAFPSAAVAPDPWSGLDRIHDPVLAAGSIRLAGELLAGETPLS